MKDHHFWESMGKYAENDGSFLLSIEKGKAIEAALPFTISLTLCYKQSAVTIGSSGGYFFPLKI